MEGGLELRQGGGLLPARVEREAADERRARVLATGFRQLVDRGLGTAGADLGDRRGQGGRDRPGDDLEGAVGVETERPDREQRRAGERPWLDKQGGERRRRGPGTANGGDPERPRHGSDRLAVERDLGPRGVGARREQAGRDRHRGLAQAVGARRAERDRDAQERRGVRGVGEFQRHLGPADLVRVAPPHLDEGGESATGQLEIDGGSHPATGRGRRQHEVRHLEPAGRDGSRLHGVLDAAAPPVGIDRREAKRVGGARLDDGLGHELDPVPLPADDPLVRPARHHLAGGVRHGEGDAEGPASAPDARRDQEPRLAGRPGHHVGRRLQRQAAVDEGGAQGGGEHRLVARRRERDAEERPRAHRGAGPGDRDLHLVRLAVAVARFRLEAEQVVPHQLTADPLERAVRVRHGVQHETSREPGEREEPARLLLPVLVERGRRVHAAHRRVDPGPLRVQEDHVEGHLRLGSEPRDVLHLGLRLRAEALRHEDHGLRPLDTLQRGEGGGEGALRPERALTVVEVHLRRVGLELPAAARHLFGQDVRLAGQLDELRPAQVVVVLGEGDRLGQRHPVAAALRLADDPLQAAAHRVVVAAELDRLARPGDERQRGPVARGEVREEAVGGLQDVAPVADADVPAIDQHQDEPAARGVLVGAEMHGRRGRRRRRLEVATDVLGGHDVPLPAVDLHLEVRGGEADHRSAVRADDARVDRDDVDAHAKDGRRGRDGRRRGLLRCSRQHRHEQS